MNRRVVEDKEGLNKKIVISKGTFHGEELPGDSDFNICPPHDQKLLLRDFVQLERSSVFEIVDKKRVKLQVFNHIALKGKR